MSGEAATTRPGGQPEPEPLGELSPIGRRSARLRLRAAWMYYVEGMTQSAIAEALDIGRVTVVRLLADARQLNEVKISLSREIAELPRLEMGLQKAFGLREAVVAPLSGPLADPTSAIGAATGQFISELIRSDMTIGFGWGRTLMRALGFIDEKTVSNLSVISLLGGITKAKQYNPSEFAWQLSRLFQADCHLIAAPAIVDSIETKQALIERCGLGAVYSLAREMDAVVVSVGEMEAESTALRFGFFSDADWASLIAAGAVGDVVYNFIDMDGRPIDHPINTRVMSIPVETMQATPERILTSGGPGKTRAVIAALRMLRPTVFITDEVTAAAVLQEVGAAY
ncbi:transcriptional regulator, DeoR family [Ancylobacter novellus DSM 506]|uniref:Transcriptional regulator, DeoR family n=1 Tax=Ancylobacter novellus (strain ATCC 8093 / DSM 506 / JCM 20403 / CCM 1077 / IAM 12100 / NBRC 12443 / NCIMB 10456) TaxID=639283 RepID=D7A3P2_ANCN5|nr:sugar-binding transcriptional regulator [Ancylobacter novellus]ADH91669.1 transcriptional regulator, DeoR family [Ancylobacter novellus DSM 506]